jgi:hypothetical protein
MPFVFILKLPLHVLIVGRRFRGYLTYFVRQRRLRLVGTSQTCISFPKALIISHTFPEYLLKEKEGRISYLGGCSGDCSSDQLSANVCCLWVAPSDICLLLGDVLSADLRGNGSE